MHTESEFQTAEQLQASLAGIKGSPREQGAVEMIVCRPAVNERRNLAACELSVEAGLLGDNWQARGDEDEHGKPANRDMQLNLMNVRVIAAIEPDATRWPLAGDQFYVDLDLSDANLPPGTRLAIGQAVIEVTAEPHLGCAKFKQRFGRDAVMFVNSDEGKALNLRGVNAKVVTPGLVKVSDAIAKL